MFYVVSEAMFSRFSGCF